MPNIMFVTASVNRGGASRVISILANHYSKMGWNVIFVIKEKIIKGYELDGRVKIIECGNENMSHGYKFLKKLKQIIKLENPNIVISFLTIVNLYSIVACVGKRKLIISERNDPKLSASGWQFEMSKLLYPLADGIVFQSQKVKGYYSDKAKRRGYVILNPINVTKHKHIFEEKKKIVTAGRFVKQKNHTMLIDAFANVRLRHDDYKLYIYGDGELRKDYQKQIDEYGIQESIILPGNVPNIHDEIADSQIFVISSDYEGLSNSLLEAMAMGIACISTRSGGAEEIIEDHKNGLLVDVGNKEQMITAIEELIADKELREYLQINALETSKRFLEVNVISEWENAISKVIGK